jgi:hypothetical protein
MPNFFEGSFMNCRPIVISVVFALVTGIAVSACQGGEDVLPLPPTDAGSDGPKGDAASKDGASGDAAESDAAATDAAAAKDTEGTETGSVGEAGPSDAAPDAAPPDANAE